MTQEERNEKTAQALEALCDVAEKQSKYIQSIESKLESQLIAFEKHEKAIGLLLREVKDLKDAKNKPLIHKP